MHAPFVHLRNHSAYSLSEGAIKADKLAALAAAASMPAVAITDSGNLFGALEFSQACVGAGVQPIIGCQISLTRAENDRLPPDPVVLLAQDEAGLANLQRLSSAGFMQGDPASPQLPWNRVAQHAEGLVLLTGGSRGPVARLLAEGRRPDAAALVERMSEAFAGRTLIELHRHGTALDTAIEPGLLQLAADHDLPLLATNECFFPKPAMAAAHDALLCIAEGRQVSDPARRRVTPEHWFKDAATMRALFHDLPDACDNTLAVARMCAVMAEKRNPLLPSSPKIRPGMTEAETLAVLAQEGLARRQIPAGRRAEYEQRLAYELGVIEAMGFPGYFLIVADFIQWAKAQDIPVGPGRGSGAGSVVAWALTITDLDPLAWGLLFERFLNPERVSMPDFDIDFCQDRRDEVIDYVRREYGADRVAQIITFGKLQARAAVRDVGRVLGLPFGQVNRVAELIPNNPAKPVTLAQAIDGEPRLQEMQSDEGVKRLLDLALQLEGLYRHASTHAAGLVIGDRPLIDLVPLYRDAKTDTLVTQYSMKYVEQAGLVKFDFLGLTTLTILKQAVGLLAGLGVAVDLDTLPLDDPATYAMLARGDAGGVFQFESPGMRDVLRQMRPDRFEDLIAAVALYRPGPMANIPDYCRRKHGEPWAPPHPQLAPILAETYGIMVYQEQVMQIAQTMAGYSLGAADLLRRAMGKKIRAEMEQQRATFTGGATARGIAPAKATEVFDLMAKFADYGFNKSHAAAYALVSYQTAWMKANHPVAFLAACMNLALANTDKIAALRQETERMGIRVLPPDINRSSALFSVEVTDGVQSIRYALAAVKKVGQAAMEALCAVRGERPFADLADLATRVDPRPLNKMQLENLARAGAFDTLNPNRAQASAGADTILKRAQAQAEEAATGQAGLFGGGGRPEPLRLPPTPDWPEMERLAFEAEAIGFHLTAHPMDSYAPALKRLGVVPAASVDARARAGETRLRLAGCIVGTPGVRRTKSGSPMMWVALSDASGTAEVTLFSEVLMASRDVLKAGAAVTMKVDVRLDGDSVRLTAADCVSLDVAAAETGVGLRIWLDRTEAVPHIRSILAREAGGRGTVTLVPRLDDVSAVEITVPGTYQVGPRLGQALKAVPGVDRVEEC